MPEKYFEQYRLLIPPPHVGFLYCLSEHLYFKLAINIR
jgi:hypothetical protein